MDLIFVDELRLDGLFNYLDEIQDYEMISAKKQDHLEKSVSNVD